MKRIFRRKSRANSTSEPDPDVRLRDRRFSVPTSIPMHQEVEVLHTYSPPDGILPTATNDNDNISIALSEAATLAYDKRNRLELQDAFDDNFTSYLPYVLRRMRIERNRELVEAMHEFALASDSEDAKTMTSANQGFEIMARKTDRYNTKRSLVMATEYIKNNTYVFAEREAFQLFKHLRSNNKKLRKNSVIVFDAKGNIKRIQGENAPPGDPSEVVDSRAHIIPVDYKLKGEGLPLFKILVPYMSSFRKKVPYMVFRRYREVPLRPSGSEDEEFESYDFCTVHVKHFQAYKRYTFQFTPVDGPEFKILAFQNNYRPFTDFVHRSTRFRIVGTSLASAYLMNYNPELKLLVIDPAMPSLCDGLVNKQPGFDLKNVVKKRGLVHLPEVEPLPEDPADFPNPVPLPMNPILVEDEGGFMGMSRRNYIPSEMPPFGRFLDSCVYSDEVLLLPKRYSEVGMIEVYQDRNQLATYLTSTLSVDLDTLVLTAILLTLRETGIRNSNRSQNNSLGRFAAFGGPMPGPYPGPRLGSMETSMGYPFNESL